MRGVETKWRRLGDVARGTQTVSRGMEVILQIWRLGDHFCAAHGASAPPSSIDMHREHVISINNAVSDHISKNLEKLCSRAKT